MNKISSGWSRVVKTIRDVFRTSPSKEDVHDSSSELKTLFADSATRPAGYRQALSIDGEEYGFRWIPAGEFDMGSPESEWKRRDGETLHHVKLTRGFWLLETPITQRLYESVMGENPSWFKKFDFSRLLSECETFDDVLTRALKGEFSDLPVESVSFDDVVDFCKKLSASLPFGMTATLPTSAEWEYACRAGASSPFWFGDSLDGRKANYRGSNLGQTSPVKLYPPNPWGLYDMHGNVWEWTSDRKGAYPTCETTDPTGADVGGRFMTRGGSWENGASRCRAAYRRSQKPYWGSSNLGARIVLRPQFEAADDEEKTRRFNLVY